MASRACAVFKKPHMYLGRGTMIKRRGASLAVRGPIAQSFRCRTLAFWSLVGARASRFWAG
eukprot:7668611-Pyramimonas_sp.AAC.1